MVVVLSNGFGTSIQRDLFLGAKPECNFNDEKWISESETQTMQLGHPAGQMSTLVPAAAQRPVMESGTGRGNEQYI